MKRSAVAAGRPSVKKPPPRPRTVRIERALRQGFGSFNREREVLDHLVHWNPALVRRLEHHLGENPEAAEPIEHSFAWAAGSQQREPRSMLSWELERGLEDQIAHGNTYPFEKRFRLGGRGWNPSYAEHFAALCIFRATRFLLAHGQIAAVADALIEAGTGDPDARRRRRLKMRAAALVDAPPPAAARVTWLGLGRNPAGADAR